MNIDINKTNKITTPFVKTNSVRTFQARKIFPNNNNKTKTVFNKDDRAKNPRRFSHGKPEKIKPEFDQKILNIRRVTRVTKGGKKMNFSVHIVIGNKKGSIGVGTGKANDTSLAIDKAYKNAKKNIMVLNLTKTMSIPYDVSAKYCSGRVLLIPAKGRGVSAGSALKSVIELTGIKDITAKIISPSKNKLNIARAAILALSVFDKRKQKIDSGFMIQDSEKIEQIQDLEIK
ncbi:MAG: 30S ribosomal protein S5 [bacterium]